MEREKKRRDLSISTDLVHLAPCMRLDTDSLKFQAPLSIRFLYALNEDPNISQTFVATRHIFSKKFKPSNSIPRPVPIVTIVQAMRYVHVVPDVPVVSTR
jgi:hypothetical protein